MSKDRFRFDAIVSKLLDITLRKLLRSECLRNQSTLFVSHPSRQVQPQSDAALATISNVAAEANVLLPLFLLAVFTITYQIKQGPFEKVQKAQKKKNHFLNGKGPFYFYLLSFILGSNEEFRKEKLSDSVGVLSAILELN